MAELSQALDGLVLTESLITDKPKWDINVFGEEEEKGAKHQVVLKA